MARGRSLLYLLQNYRSEIRASANPAHNAGVEAEQKHLLQRVQERLYDDHDWPHLRVERYFDLQAGQRYYDPLNDMALDRVERLDVRYGRDWRDLEYGIGDECLSVHDSDGGERSWPAAKWEVYEDEQIEIWPVPSQSGARYLDPNTNDLEGRIRVTGIRSLRPLVRDNDVADLDDRLLVLSAAAETLAANGAKDAGLKLEAAQSRLRSLKGNWTKSKRFRMFGVGDLPRRHRPHIPAVHYRDRETG